MQTMIMGADVTHPGAHSGEGTPSIAAVVATVDERLDNYLGSMHLQKGKIEVITDLAAMFVRDYWLGLTQHTFLSEQEYGFVHSKGRINGNLRAGAVIDQGVTSPNYFDFYLQAHATVKGKARPAHYFVLLDEMNWNSNELQQFTNDICYTFARATKGVSSATPAYLADRFYERGRCYLRELLEMAWDRPAHLPVDDPGLKQNMVDYIKDRAELWKPSVGASGVNPWHTNLDDIMFYL
ncbi:MAG: hypothetical protein M1827_004104 [Pycnora praestabilis]|nr:MAG: hypothetical protein M1827_004104 [Pycnora praestabilis]